MVGEGGFEPPKHDATDLQSAPFGHSGILPYQVCAEMIRERGLTGSVHVLTHDCGPEIQELLKSGEVDFTIGQDLAYQPYQALSVLFEALMGQRPDRDTYVTACPILNSESI